MARKTRSENELRSASDFLHYEVWMLQALACELSAGKPGQGPIKNALLESFVIHARVLLDFLYACSPRPDDIIAEDFFPVPDKWREQRRRKTELLKTVRRRVGKEAAHLTYARLCVGPDTKGWEYFQIAQDICRVFDQFLAAVSAPLLGTRWNGLKKSAKVNKDENT